MKPQCPLLKGEGPGQAKQNVPQGGTNENPRRQNQRATSQGSAQGEVNALEQRIKKQMEEMEKRMLEAIGALAAPRQNYSGQKASHAKAVRTPSEENI